MGKYRQHKYIDSITEFGLLRGFGKSEENVAKQKKSPFFNPYFIGAYVREQTME